MTRSYYEIFGVKRTASGDEIRAAYLALVKRHHPDVAGPGGGGSAPDMIALLNRCYAVLKDPRQRAAYDAQLVHQSPSRQAPVSVRRAVVPHAHKAPKRDWRVPLLVAGLAAAAVLVQVARGPIIDAYNAGSFLTWGRAAAQPRPERPLRAQDVARATELATTVSAEQAERVSNRCFDAAQQDTDLTSAKLCIIFDDAFLYWRQNASDYDTMPLYFRDEVTRMRHLDALGGNDDAERTVAQLRDMTFKALLSQLTHVPIGTAVSPGSVAEPERLQSGSGGARSQNGTPVEKKYAVPVHI